MKRLKNPLVVDLETAAEMLLSTANFLKKEIKLGNLRAVKMGNKTVIRTEELKEYLLRKEPEEPAIRKSQSRNKSVPIVNIHDSDENSATKDALEFPKDKSGKTEDLWETDAQEASSPLQNEEPKECSSPEDPENPWGRRHRCSI